MYHKSQQRICISTVKKNLTNHLEQQITITFRLETKYKFAYDKI